ncbi:DcrB-related protein [Puniceicoccus vermicola]|uniref:DcrB-related protein n=1 Tax=Puniceicoccus vermicola TaxID=388746 RepID=A0A7X1B148_9BACT|nr:DcrB-related protein [Puniceicoccus vermicola]MBC2603632.1 DcrB-related protein [Puniceicoccus vermicola]
MNHSNHTKSRRKFSCIFLLSLLLLPVEGLYSQEVEWQSVSHPQMLLFIPSGWEIQTTPDSSDIEATSPLTGEQDDFQEFLLVQVDTVESDESLNQFADSFIDELSENVEDFQQTQREPSEFGDNSGLKIDATAEIDGEKIYLRIFLTQQENRIYVSQFRSNRKDMDGMEPLMDQILAGIHPYETLVGQSYYNNLFVIQFPQDWSVKEGLPGTHVAGISPQTDPKDPFRDRFTVGSQPLKEGMTYDKYVDKNFDTLLSQLPGAQKINEGTRTVAGVEARELELFHRAGGQKTFLRIVMVEKSGRIFTLFCAGMNPDYENFRPTFDKILNSFASPTPPSNVATNP